MAEPDSARRAAPEKSARAFRTISEVAAELDVPQHVLRFWETKFSQVKPMKRAGGRRYYRPEDVALLQRIRALLYSEGYTIKGVQKVLRAGNGHGSPAEAANPAAAPQAATAELKPSPPGPEPAPVAAAPVPTADGHLDTARVKAIRDALLTLRGELETLL